jgi:hypothetical protein
MKYSKVGFFLPVLFCCLSLTACSPNSVEPVPANSCNKVQIIDAPPDSLQLDSFDLKAMTINGDALVVDLVHGGGCREHFYALFMSPSVFLESYPVQANLYLRHNANGDLCKALLHPQICFDLRPVAEQYFKFYQGNDPAQCLWLSRRAKTQRALPAALKRE